MKYILILYEGGRVIFLYQAYTVYPVSWVIVPDEDEG